MLGQAVHLPDDLRVTFGDVLLVASALVALGTAVGLAWRKVIRPVRLAARQAFVHSVGEAARAAVVDAIAPTVAKVDDLHNRLSTHLTEESVETVAIHASVDRAVASVEALATEVRATFEARSRDFEQGVAPWRARFERLEASHVEILGQLESISAGQATVIHAVGGDNP